MEALEAATRTAQPIVEIGGGFMTDGATYARGGELGFSGIDFYVLGRGGVLGDVASDVIAAGFIFWSPEQVRAQWETGRGVLAPAAAATEWAACCAAWGEAQLPDSPGADRLAELLTTVVAAASPANASLFAGWRALPAPSSTKARLAHDLNALRELRGALHGGALLASGVTPAEAVVHRSPMMAPLFGWDVESIAVTDEVKARWRAAEAATDIAMGRVLEALDADGRAALVESLTALHGAWVASKGA